MEELEYKPKSSWEMLSATRHKKSMLKLADDYLAFLSLCKTERETVAFVEDRLRKAGFEPGIGKNGCFVSLHGKAVFAVRKGKKPLNEGIHLIAAHTDTPRLDFKQRPLIEQVGVGQAKTHYYGGIRKYQWLARPLAIHGLVVRKDGSHAKVVLGEKDDDPVFCIADLLPHLAQKDMEKSLRDAFEAEKLNVILGHQPVLGQDKDKKPENPVKAQMLKLLNQYLQINEEDLLSAELQAVPSGPARYVGLDKAIVGGYGQDDRACIYTALQAFLETDSPEHATCLIFWDKEEIGSEGATSAHSRFFEYCLQDLLAAWESAEGSKTSFSKMLLASRALSADVHSAIDPDWQELHEKQNSALFGYGPSFSKFTGSRGKYGANDANPEYVGYLRSILNAKKIPWQMAELGKVDLGGGGTVALFLAALGMSVIDVGPALLSMHSPFELASVPDLYATKLAYQAFLEAE